MVVLSERAKAIQPSITLDISAQAKQMKADGMPILNFSAGEPDFDTPEEIKQAAVKAMAEGFTKYTPAGGIPEVKNAIIAKYARGLGIKYSPSEVLVSNGGKHAIHNIFQTVLDPGDEVIIPGPYWLSYPEMVKISGGVPVVVCGVIENKYKLAAEDIEKAVTPRTKILIINSPSNPTGAVYAAEELENIARVAESAGILVLSDDVYEKFVYDNTRFVNILSVAPAMKDQVVIINSASKTYSMPGWRIGWALGPAPVIKAATSLQGQATSCPGSISQKALTFALTLDERCIEAFRRSFEQRRDLFHDGLSSIQGIQVPKPGGAFYLFADVGDWMAKRPGLTGSVEACKYLLEKGSIACIPGAAFGDDRCIRFSFVTDEESIQQAVVRLKTL